MEIVKMTSKHISEAKRMGRIFYDSDAVAHEVSDNDIENNIAEAIGENPYFNGYIMVEDGKPVGFSYVSEYYETEIGGMCVMIIDLYIEAEYRRRGFGSELFKFVFKNYPHAKRFRLEVEENNTNAISVYKKLGFEKLGYMQMIKEV